MTCRTTHHLACDCREAEFAAKDKRIAELETSIRQYERWCEDAEPRLDALSALVEEMHDWTVGEGDHEFAWDSWLARARAAIGEGNP